MPDIHNDRHDSLGCLVLEVIHIHVTWEVIHYTVSKVIQRRKINLPYLQVTKPISAFTRHGHKRTKFPLCLN